MFRPPVNALKHTVQYWVLNTSVSSYLGYRLYTYEFVFLDHSLMPLLYQSSCDLESLLNKIMSTWRPAVLCQLIWWLSGLKIQYEHLGQREESPWKQVEWDNALVSMLIRTCYYFFYSDWDHGNRSCTQWKTAVFIMYLLKKNTRLLYFFIFLPHKIWHSIICSIIFTKLW